jgi:4-amino-4-deoxy-L-arabinose transferase-like glycosyltransferase
MTVQQARKRSQTLAGWWPYGLIALLALPLLLWHLDTHPVPWFDEGFTTHAARMLTEQGVYGTYNVQDGYVHFDSGVSTGPAVVLAIAVSFKVLGHGMWQARLVNVIFGLVLLWSCFALMRRLYGTTFGLLAVLILLAWPNFAGVGLQRMSRQVLGEVPALAFLALGWNVLFSSWGTQSSKRSTVMAALAGVLFGLGIITKSQVGIVFLPALGLISLLRLRTDYKNLIRWALPVIMTLLTFIAWRTFEYWGQQDASAAIKAANTEGYIKSIQLLLLPFNFGRWLNRSDWVLLFIMFVGSVSCLWRARVWQLLKPAQKDEQYQEATLGLFVFLYAVWFGFVSIGWARYGFVGYMISVLLCAKFGFDVLGWVFARLPEDWRPAQPSAVRYKLMGVLVAGLVGSHCVDLFTMQPDDSAQLTADYIRTQIPREAVIETMEWELDAISGHWELHHPAEADSFEAIQQIFYERHKPNLTYDELQANPDYLIVGAMSDFTGVYDEEALNKHFKLLNEFGAYKIYQRLRSQ